jgi:hypothetical protein
MGEGGVYREVHKEGENRNYMVESRDLEIKRD